MAKSGGLAHPAYAAQIWAKGGRASPGGVDPGGSWSKADRTAFSVACTQFSRPEVLFAASAHSHITEYDRLFRSQVRRPGISLHYSCVPTSIPSILHEGHCSTGLGPSAIDTQEQRHECLSRSMESIDQVGELLPGIEGPPISGIFAIARRRKGRLNDELGGARAFEVEVVWEKRVSPDSRAVSYP